MYTLLRVYGNYIYLIKHIIVAYPFFSSRFVLFINISLLSLMGRQCLYDTQYASHVYNELIYNVNIIGITEKFCMIIFILLKCFIWHLCPNSVCIKSHIISHVALRIYYIKYQLIVLN